MTIGQQDLVGEVLMRLNYSSDLILSARGSIVIRNWKPLPTDKVAEGPLLTVGDILAELINLATLKIQVYRSRPPPPTPASEVRDKLLRLLLLRSHAVLVAAGCPLDEVIFFFLLLYLANIAVVNRQRNIYRNNKIKKKGKPRESLSRRLREHKTTPLKNV